MEYLISVSDLMRLAALAVSTELEESAPSDVMAILQRTPKANAPLTFESDDTGPVPPAKPE